MESTPASLMARLCGLATEPRTTVDETAWARFVDLYTPLLHHWARRLEPQEADALDLLQEVFLHLHRKLPEFLYNRGKSFRSWLRTLMFNKWRDRRRAGPAPAIADSHVLDQVTARDTLAEFTEADYRRYLVRRAMELMKTDFEPSTWKAFWEAAVHERPAAEVAQELHLSVAAVYKAVSRVRKCLRQELEGLLS